MSLYSRAETNAQSLKVLNTTEVNSVDKYDHDNTLIVDGASTVAGAQGYTTAARRVIFIDQVEAGLAENKERGLTSPGWWEYMTYTDASGKTRHKAQHLVAFANAPANTADLDDAVAADVASAITISVQPTDQTEPVGDPAAFAVTAALDIAGNLVYLWQRRSPSTGRWTNITGTLDSAVYSDFDTDTLLISAVSAGMDGYEYRVKITSDVGSEEVISDSATLTVTTP